MQYLSALSVQVLVLFTLCCVAFCEPTVQELKCQVCKALVTESVAAISKVDPKRRYLSEALGCKPMELRSKKRFLTLAPRHTCTMSSTKCAARWTTTHRRHTRRTESLSCEPQ
uniref:Putative secreted protein n=1 Tax=Rhipicephalus microplus TaxID=6941 RepID=A0A6G5A416_RHIMP